MCSSVYKCKWILLSSSTPSQGLVCDNWKEERRVLLHGEILRHFPRADAVPRERAEMHRIFFRLTQFQTAAACARINSTLPTRASGSAARCIAETNWCNQLLWLNWKNNSKCMNPWHLDNKLDAPKVDYLAWMLRCKMHSKLSERSFRNCNQTLREHENLSASFGWHQNPPEREWWVQHWRKYVTFTT